jgi:energy-coupling factor transporter ATP-binding protein EcfA2
VAPIIEIADYSWRYLNTASPALNAVNLTVEAGAFVGIIGPNGSGKTTLAYSIDGLIPAQYRGVKAGSVAVLGREVETYAPGELQRIVGVVFSDPEAQFTAMTVEDELVFGLENLELSLAEIRERLGWVVELTQIGHLLEKPPYEISGGQKQRVALAAVLAMTPRIIILDEPTSMLDPVSRKRVFEVLVKLKQEQRNTIVIIEHSLEHLAPLADRMILLAQGEVRLESATRDFFGQLDRLLEYGVHPPGAMVFFHRLANEGLYDGPMPLSVGEAAALLERQLAGRRAPLALEAHA